MVSVMFFGDSICYGQFVSPHATWVTQVSRSLSERFGERIWVSNCGISGNTTRMALERMPSYFQSHNIDIVLVQFGINDCNLWRTDKGLPRVSRKAFHANLEEIIDRARRFGARHVLLTTNHPTTKMIELDGETIPHQRGNSEYNEVIRQVARDRNDVVLIDIDELFSAQPETQELLLPDGVHLSLRGHNLYYSAVYPDIERAVESTLQVPHEDRGRKELGEANK